MNYCEGKYRIYGENDECNESTNNSCAKSMNCYDGVKYITLEDNLSCQCKAYRNGGCYSNAPRIRDEVTVYEITAYDKCKKNINLHFGSVHWDLFIVFEMIGAVCGYSLYYFIVKRNERKQHIALKSDGIATNVTAFRHISAKTARMYIYMLDIFFNII